MKYGKPGSIEQEGSAEHLRILIAEDSDSDRLILQTIVKKEGHRVYTAEDGQEAIELFKEYSPDIVLLDALMPNVDGFEAARTIKQLAGDDLVPIIFLTSLRDVASLADCMAAGGIDFLSKPYNRIILHAKIKAYASMRRLHAMVQQQRDEIALHNDRLMHEQEVAKQVFDNIAHPGCINASNIKYLLSPMAVFNGDLVLAARKPSGGMCVFLGDFTGHGLPAAIGAMPVSEIFYGMTRKGFSLQDIILEINKRLKTILPVGVFCCACMLEVSFRKRLAEIWVGGLPDVLVYRSQSRKLEQLESRHLPLGVVDNSRFKVESSQVALDPGDKVLLWSDGIIEAANSLGEMFGEERIKEVILNSDTPDIIFTNIIKAVELHSGRCEQDDDYTMVEVTMLKEEDIDFQIGDAKGFSLEGGPKDWSMTYELRAQSLREFNPLPVVTHLLMEVPGLRPYSGKLYTILSELYSNALEHGVLGLDSEVKASADGFARYYEQRASKLNELKQGYVRFTIDHRPLSGGGCLRIGVTDAGPGFDYAAHEGSGQISPQDRYSGRGLSLLNSLCDSVHYLGTGNQVEVMFNWHVDS